MAFHLIIMSTKKPNIFDALNIVCYSAFVRSHQLFVYLFIFGWNGIFTNDFFLFIRISLLIESVKTCFIKMTLLWQVKWFHRYTIFCCPFIPAVGEMQREKEQNMWIMFIFMYHWHWPFLYQWFDQFYALFWLFSSNTQRHSCIID